MLNKLFSFLGFNGNENYIGLSKIVDNEIKIQAQPAKPIKKELKLSDLMRGN